MELIVMIDLNYLREVKLARLEQYPNPEDCQTQVLWMLFFATMNGWRQ